MARRNFRRRPSRRTQPLRSWEWVRVSGFFISNTEGTAPRGVDLLSNFRSQPNANYQNATITSIRGFVSPAMPTDTTGIRGGVIGFKIDDWDMDPSLISNLPANGPDEDWMGWFPWLKDYTYVPPLESSWHDRWAIDLKSSRIVRQRQQTLWLMGDPGVGVPVTYNYNLSIGMKLH